MALSKRSRIGIVAIVLFIILCTVFAPFLVSKGVLAWFWWKTRGTEVQITTESIQAPFLHPIVLRGFHLQTTSAAPVHIDVVASQVVFGLNLKAILLRTRGATLQTLAVDGLHVNIRRERPGQAFSDEGWNTVHRLLPQSFAFKPFELRIENAPTVVLARGVSITGTPVEVGRFEAVEVVVSSPLFRQSFYNLKGATEWQGDRLTIAALTLAQGLDVQSLTTDLSGLGKRRVALEFDLDAFGGKLRGSLADEWRSRRTNLTIAGSANDISLSQTAEAFGFTDRLGGLVHAGKFTFRGDLAEPLSGTASLWVELTGPAWRDREADLITLGLSLYGRQVELQQLYIKQKNNELTLNGESSFPKTAAGWLRPDFRGTVSAAIDDLGEFASLFGGDRNDFAGRIEVRGTLDARDRNFGGTLVATGSGLTMFRRSIDEFHAEFGLRKDAIEIGQIEFKRGDDLLRAQGRVETGPEHNYSGTLDATIEDIDDDLSMIWGPVEAQPMSATFHADIASSVWDAHAVFDPPKSQPITIAATFPLRIGQPLDALWNSPVTMTVDCPELHLSEIPRRSAGFHFTGGILSAQVAMADAPKHPHVTGYAQLSGAKLGADIIDGRVRLDGSHGAIESFRLSANDQDASFYGDIDLQDTQQLRIRFFPNQPLVDFTSPLLDCATGIHLVPVLEPQFDTEITEIDLNRSGDPPNWTVLLKQIGYESFPMLTQNSGSTKAYGLCDPAKNSGTLLEIGAEAVPTPTPSPTPPRPKKRRR